jgi:hypothetical protein
MRQVGHTERITVSKLQSKLQSQNLKRRGRQDNSIMHIQEIKCGDVEWIHFAEEVVSLFHPHIGNNRFV